MNTTLREIPHYLSKTIADQVAADPEIVNLSIGEPYFLPPRQLENRFAELLQANIVASGHLPNRYAPSRGSEALRQAICVRYERLYGVSPDPAHSVLVTHGAAEAIWLSVLSLTSAGDEVLIPDPSYMLYETVIRLLGRIPVRIPVLASEGFQLEPEKVSSAITPKTKLLFINSPNNPTGSVHDREHFLALGALAEQYGFYIAHDEVYDCFLYGGRSHYNLLREGNLPPYLVLINSFSKHYAMMGWRLGWMVASPVIIEAATKIHTNLTLNLGNFHQDAAAVLLNDPEVDAEIESHVAQIERQMGALASAIRQNPGFVLEEENPAGAFFLFPDIMPLYEQLDSHTQSAYASPSEAVAAFMIKKIKIAVVPGYIYGPSGHNHVRIVGAAAPAEIRRACEKLGQHGLFVP